MFHVEQSKEREMSMSIQNGLNNTQEIEQIQQNPLLSPVPNPLESPLESLFHQESAESPARPVNPAGSRSSSHVRTPIRRASMIAKEQTSEAEMHYRRPPRQQSKSVKRNANGEKNSKKKKRKRKKHLSCIGRLIASLLTLCLVLFVIYSAIAISAIKKIQFQETDTRHLEENSLAKLDDQVRNLLLIGTDSRMTEKGHVESIHIFSISKHNKTITLTSLLEDCYVNIPTIGADKLRNAYAYGGPTMLMDTITNEFGIPIDEFICVGYSAYINLVNALGGLEMDVSEQTVQQINRVLKDEINMKLRADDQSDLLRHSGEVVLNGKQLLAYSRMQNSDGFDKINLQDIVLKGILDKLKSADFSTLSDIAKDAFPVLWTNMSTLKLYGLTITLPIQLIRYDFQTLQLPGQNTYQSFISESGEKGFTVDYDANLKLFQSYMTNPPVTS